MADYTPQQIDHFVAQLFGHEHDNASFASALSEMASAEIPEMNISASEGMLLHTLARAFGAKRILEIGALGGYSALWLASALPADGKLITLELDEKHAAIATKNIARAGYATKVDVIVGAAADSLKKLEEDGVPEFDITFIDANKDGYCDYLDHAIRLTRLGGVILADNTLTHDAMNPSADTGITRFNKKLAATHGLQSAMIPTLRDSIDGLTISVITSK